MSFYCTNILKMQHWIKIYILISNITTHQCQYSNEIKSLGKFSCFFLQEGTHRKHLHIFYFTCLIPSLDISSLFCIVMDYFENILVNNFKENILNLHEHFKNMLTYLNLHNQHRLLFLSRFIYY